MTLSCMYPGVLEGSIEMCPVNNCSVVSLERPQLESNCGTSLSSTVVHEHTLEHMSELGSEWMNLTSVKVMGETEVASP